MLILLPVLFFLNASAQQPYYDFKKFDPQTRIYQIPKDKLPNKDSLPYFLDKLSEKTRQHSYGNLLFTQPNGTRVYSLPQDNLICLVPDMSQFNMPVIGKEIKITGMPPFSVPPNNIIPKKP